MTSLTAGSMRGLDQVKLQTDLIYKPSEVVQLYILPGGNHERLNGALNVVHFEIFSSLANIESYNSYQRGIFTASPM